MRHHMDLAVLMLAAAVITVSIFLAGYMTMTGLPVLSKNESYALVSVSIMNAPPNVTLITPPNNSINTTGNVSFVINITDDFGLANASLFMGNGTTFFMNQSLNLTGTGGIIVFNLTNMSAGRYYWNVKACDSNELCAFAADNFTFLVMLAENFTLTVLVDGIIQNFTEAGVPVNLTIIANNTLGPVPNVHIIIEEINGLSFFPMPQISQSNFSNMGLGDTYTRFDGTVSLAVIPTGGIPPYDPFVGDYFIRVTGWDSVNHTDQKLLLVLNRDSIGSINRVSLPNSANIGTSVTTSFQIFDSLNEYLNNPSGKGINRNITINVSGNATGVNFTFVTSQPTGLYINITNGSQVVPNVSIEMTEINGFYIFIFPQFSDTDQPDVSNLHRGYVQTNATGMALFVVVPTGGNPSYDSILGNYTINMTVKLPDGGMIYNMSFPVDRTITRPGGFPLTEIPNSNNVGTDTTNLIIMLSNVNDRLNAP